MLFGSAILATRLKVGSKARIDFSGGLIHHRVSIICRTADFACVPFLAIVFSVVASAVFICM